MKRKELIQYKKDCFLSELAWAKDANALRHTHVWRIRFYLGTITAAFLGFSVFSNDNLSLMINSGALLLLGFFLVVVFALYDCHVADLSVGHVERFDTVAKLLNRMPTASRAELVSDEFKTHKSTRESYNKLPTWRERYKRKISHSKAFDFRLFYLAIILIWAITTWIRSGYFAIWRL